MIQFDHYYTVYGKLICSRVTFYLTTYFNVPNGYPA